MKKTNVLVLAGLALAVLLAAAGMRSSRTTTKFPGKTTSISELDRRAQPFFEEAEKNIPKVVSELSGTPAFLNMCGLAVVDKISGSNKMEQKLASVIMEILGISRPTLRAYVKSGRLTQIKLSQRKIRFDESEILHFANTGMSAS